MLTRRTGLASKVARVMTIVGIKNKSRCHFSRTSTHSCVMFEIGIGDVIVPVSHGGSADGDTGVFYDHSPYFLQPSPVKEKHHKSMSTAHYI